MPPFWRFGGHARSDALSRRSSPAGLHGPTREGPPLPYASSRAPGGDASADRPLQPTAVVSLHGSRASRKDGEDAEVQGSEGASGTREEGVLRRVLGPR
jgi:hypothetical protein